MSGRGPQVIGLSGCGQRRTDVARFCVTHVQIREDCPPLVHLRVFSAGTSTHHRLEPGDTFTVADQRWCLDRIENLHDPRGQWEVILLRAGWPKRGRGTVPQGPLAQDPEFRTVHAPPRFPSVTASPVLCRAVTLRGRPVGYLWAATTDDAAGFVARKRAGADAFNTSVRWAERLRRAKANGLTPLQALRHWPGDDEDPQAGEVAGGEEEHPTLAALEAETELT